MTERILIMGLPGAGKTYLAERLTAALTAHNKTVAWFNADAVRKEHNDWDFTDAGRLRQVIRMTLLSEECDTDYAICDFVCPVHYYRQLFDADWTIWVDTIKTGRYEDTNKLFVEPTEYDFRITEQNGEHWADVISRKVLNLD